MILGGNGVLVVVDLSNLCRDRRLFPLVVTADLGLLDKLCEALKLSRLPVSRERHKADRNLSTLVDSAGRRRLRDMERAEGVEFSSLADERLPELAFGGSAEPGTLLASMDNFDDFRPTVPAIQGSSDHFICWAPGNDGGLRIELRNMGVHSHRCRSRKGESAEFDDEFEKRSTHILVTRR